MNPLASFPAVRGACFLCLLAWSTSPSLAAQSKPAPEVPQTTAPAAAPSADKSAPSKQAAEPEAKPARQLSLHDRAWLILHSGVDFDGTEKRAKAVFALGVLKGNAEAERLATAALKDEKGD